ncbi:MAG TPA: hypothetical protein VGS22_24555 [Thermoanaerobaculia bacterium]|jgi:hypothetical protein|nr:hypothetical protein [Thermoanaerobaculia bacterium]
MRRISLLFALLLLVAPAARAENAPFLFSGPLPSLLAPGATVAAYSTGLLFEIKLTANGQKIEGSPFALTVPGTSKPFRLTLDGAAFAAGQLTAKATIANGSGAALEGLRLDLVQAIETFTKKGAEGKAVVETRRQKIAAAALHFGDLDEGESSDALPLAAAGLAFGAETTEIVVRGVVSGLRYEKTLAKSNRLRQRRDRGQRNVYLADTCGQRIARLSPGGEISGFELPDQTKGTARHPASGKLAATYTNYPRFACSAPTGRCSERSEKLRGWTPTRIFCASTPKGKLWVEARATVMCYGAMAKLEQRVASIAGTDLGSHLSFDIAPDGTLWVVSAGAF